MDTKRKKNKTLSVLIESEQQTNEDEQSWLVLNELELKSTGPDREQLNLKRLK